MGGAVQSAGGPRAMHTFIVRTRRRAKAGGRRIGTAANVMTAGAMANIRRATSARPGPVRPMSAMASHIRRRGHLTSSLRRFRAYVEYRSVRSTVDWRG